MDEAGTAKLVARFRDRVGSDATAQTIVRELITHGSAAVLKDDEFAKLREETGEALGVSPNRDVYLVGSAKLGFSIKESRRYEAFGDDSDLDLAVVSPVLYEKLWSEGRRYHQQGGYWPRFSHFRNDHFNGVIKPFVLPDSPAIPTKKTLFDLSARFQLTGIAKYPVTLAIWHSMEALEDYQVKAVQQCMNA